MTVQAGGDCNKAQPTFVREKNMRVVWIVAYNPHIEKN